MPSIDYSAVRSMFPIDAVLGKLDWKPTQRRGPQLRGPCPACGREGRALSVNLDLNRFCCHGCGARGNVLELWMAVRKLPLYQAALDLCGAFGREAPTIKRRSPTGNRPASSGAPVTSRRSRDDFT